VSDDNPVHVVEEPLPRRRDAPHIIHPCCSRFTSTAI
jgi:hypothetical protein